MEGGDGWILWVVSLEAMRGEGWVYDGRGDSVGRVWMEGAREGVRLILLLSGDEIEVGSFLVIFVFCF